MTGWVDTGTSQRHWLAAGITWKGMPLGGTVRPELKELQVTYDSNSQPMHSVENLGTVPYQVDFANLAPTTFMRWAARARLKLARREQ